VGLKSLWSFCDYMLTSNIDNRQYKRVGSQWFSILCNISWFWSLWCSLQSVFHFNLWPAGTFSFSIWPVYSFEYETPGLSHSNTSYCVLYGKTVYFPENRKRKVERFGDCAGKKLLGKTLIITSCGNLRVL